MQNLEIPTGDGDFTRMRCPHIDGYSGKSEKALMYDNELIPIARALLAVSKQSIAILTGEFGRKDGRGNERC